MKLKEKIKFRMDHLQESMESNYHLKNPTEMYEMSLHVSKFWEVLSEEDRDYLQCAQDAIMDGREWTV